MKFWKRYELKKTHLYIDDEIQPIETFVECESATDFKGFEALHIIVLDIDDQLLCSDVQMEVEQMYGEVR